jgi:hypothetical protein
VRSLFRLSVDPPGRFCELAGFAKPHFRFLIKQDIAVRLQDARIKPERKFTEITSRENIEIKNLIAVLDKLVFHTYFTLWKQSLS